MSSVFALKGRLSLLSTSRGITAGITAGIIFLWRLMRVHISLTTWTFLTSWTFRTSWTFLTSWRIIRWSLFGPVHSRRPRSALSISTLSVVPLLIAALLISTLSVVPLSDSALSITSGPSASSSTTPLSVVSGCDLALVRLSVRAPWPFLIPPGLTTGTFPSR